MKKLLIPILIVFLSSCGSPDPGENIITLEKGWKISKGDNMEWALPDFDDGQWPTVDPHRTWESQLESFNGYDGYAWYRIDFILPRSFIKKAYFGKKLRIYIGKVDDTEQTYLNGQLLGQNGLVMTDSVELPQKFEGDPEAYNIARDYVIDANDPRLKWGQMNTLAVRVHDHGGGGGMYNPNPFISMIGIKDFLKIDIVSEPFEIKSDNYIKTIHLYNEHQEVSFSGILEISVKSMVEEYEVYNSDWFIEVEPGEQVDHAFTFSAPQSESYRIEYFYRVEDAYYPVYKEETAPYILTPEPDGTPRINGPKVFGVRPGHPLLYSVPVSGTKPVNVSAQDLPQGVMIDSLTGSLIGSLSQPGDYRIRLYASNSLGEDSINFTIKVGDKIQLVPPMGWNSWNCWGLTVSDEKVRSSAEAMVESGLADYGWSFINIDDGWEAPERTRSGELLSNEKFPDMKDLADYIHSLGLKIGIYSSPGPLTCGGYLGSYMHERIDARTWAAWDIDYLKYDWCSYREIAKNETDLKELQRPYIIMRDALDRVNRDIVYSLCQYGMGNVASWGSEVGGNLWRTTYDIRDTWESMASIGFSQHKHSKYAESGGFNDPDMMVVGWVGWSDNLHPTRLTVDEQYTHVSLWCLLSAPLLLGNDLSKMSDFTRSLLTNHEVLAVNQDERCDQADLVYKKDSIQVWMKNLSDGSVAAGIFNMDNTTRDVSIPLHELSFEGQYRIRDLWRQQDIGVVNNVIETTLFPHGVFLFRLIAEE